MGFSEISCGFTGFNFSWITVAFIKFTGFYLVFIDFPMLY